jgi:sporulation protein YlmC with PRC-barrel domain
MKFIGRSIGVVAALIIAFFFSATVMAASTSSQKTNDQSQSMSSDQQKQQPDPGMQGKSSLNGMLKASNIIDKDITNAQGEELGEVKELLVDENGQIVYLIISHGGVLGIGDELVAVPWSAARTRFNGDKLNINVSKEKLNQAPTFKNENDWAGFFTPDHQEEVRGYYDNPQTGREGTPAGTRTGTGDKGTSGTKSQD